MELDDVVRTATGLDDLPGGYDPARWAWVDLDGEGAAGLLTEQGGAWWYKPSLGEGHFAPARRLGSQPPGTTGAVRWMDLDGDGKLEAVFLGPGLALPTSPTSSA